MWSKAAAAAAVVALTACRAQPSEPRFPTAHRDVAPTVSDTFSTEDARDRVGEAEQVMELAGVTRGMSVADVGAAAQVRVCGARHAAGQVDDAGQRRGLSDGFPPCRRASAPG